MAEGSWLLGSQGRPIAEAHADAVASAAARDAPRVHLTEFANRHALREEGRLRCVACKGQAIRDADELKCLMCGRTLAWIGTAPVRQEQARAELIDERSSEQHRQAARARWHGKAGQCLKGHKIEGDNVMRWGGRDRCRRCYLEAHRACPRGHEYTAENTKPTKSGKRRCRACDERPSVGESVARGACAIELGDLVG